MKCSSILLAYCMALPAVAGYQQLHTRNSDHRRALYVRTISPSEGGTSRGNSPPPVRVAKAKSKGVGPARMFGKIGSHFIVGGGGRGRRLNPGQPGSLEIEHPSYAMAVFDSGAQHAAPPQDPAQIPAVQPNKMPSTPVPARPAHQDPEYVGRASAIGPSSIVTIRAPEGGSGFARVSTPTGEETFNIAGGQTRTFGGRTSAANDVRVKGRVTDGGKVTAHASMFAEPNQPDQIREVH